MEDNILKEDLSKNKKLTPELKKKRRKVLEINLFIIIFIVVYMFDIKYAYYTVELNTLSNILKAISVVFLIISIFKFDAGYRKDNEGIFLTGIEILIIALISLFMTTLINVEEHIFSSIIYGICIFTGIYYLLKSFVKIRRIRKEHNKQISDVRKIIEK